VFSTGRHSPPQCCPWNHGGKGKTDKKNLTEKYSVITVEEATVSSKVKRKIPREKSRGGKTSPSLKAKGEENGGNTIWGEKRAVWASTSAKNIQCPLSRGGEV